MKRLISKVKIKHNRIRAKIKGEANCPRLCVFRSNRYIFGQIVDDQKGITLVSASDLKSKNKLNKTESAKKIGMELADVAKAKKIEKVVFDRGGRKFHGRVKALADGARERGLKF